MLCSYKQNSSFTPTFQSEQGACSEKGIPTLPACRQAGVGVPLQNWWLASDQP